MLNDNAKKNNRNAVIVFTIYMAALIWLVMFKLGFSVSALKCEPVINLIPFYYQTPSPYWFAEVFYNVIAFIPLGIYLGYFSDNKRIFLNILLILAISIVFESCQYIFTIGRTDITDVITNTLGGIIGLNLYRSLENTYQNAIKLINHLGKEIEIFAALLTVLMIIFR